MQPNMIAGSLLEPSLRLWCVYIFIPWPSLGDLAPPVSSRCPTWRSRGADLSLFLSVFSWFQRRFFWKVSFLLLSCVCMCVYVCYSELFFPQLKPPGEYRGEVVARLRARCAQAFPWNLSITFYCSDNRCSLWNIHAVSRHCYDTCLVNFKANLEGVVRSFTARATEDCHEKYS